MKSMRTQPMPAALARSSCAASPSPCGARTLMPKAEGGALQAAGAASRRSKGTKSFRRTVESQLALSIIYTSRVRREVQVLDPPSTGPGRGSTKMQFRELAERYQLQKILKST